MLEEDGEFELKYTFPVVLLNSIEGWLAITCGRDETYPESRVQSIYLEAADARSYYEKVNSDFFKTKFRVRWYERRDGRPYVDENKKPLDGSKTYRVHIPADPPAKDFWALTIYDTQTRSLLQTDQPYPTIGSQTEGLVQNADGSFDVYFGPEAQAGYENNWLQTIPGKSWFVALRLYGPLQPWIDKTWKPSEILLVE